MHEQEFTFEDLKSILEESVGPLEFDISTDLDRSFEELGLDSLAVVELQLAVEMRFGLVISDLAAEQITTLRAGIDYVNLLLAGGQPLPAADSLA